MMILGKIQKLQVMRHSDFGVYLNTPENEEQEAILLPRKQVPEGAEVGDEIEVFVYRDSEDRLIATTEQPKITIDSIGRLKVVDNTRIGAFLDWGLQKDLFLPFKQQVGSVLVGKEYLVGLYVDKSDRLCATMKVYDVLSCHAPYKENQQVKGTVYRIQEDMGVFVAVDNHYHGLIPTKEVFGTLNIGDTIEARVKKVRPDGKLELSLRRQTFQQIEVDAKKIMDALEAKGGALPLHDKSEPQQVKAILDMSKASFKRAVGRLLKEGAIKITDSGIQKAW
ncbi:MAG: CvfB family protein [Cellulosilyticaceae bacterium]